MLFRPTVLAAAVSLATVAQAQYSIDPESVPIAERKVWCNTQVESCPLICSQTKPGTTLVNECDADTLFYGCLCGDNKKPNISEYSLTIPYFVCREWGTQCVAACDASNSQCASECRQDHPCGALNPKRTDPTTATTAAPTSTKTDDDGTTIFTGSPGGGSDDDDEGGAVALALGQSYGLAVVAGALFMGFAML
ncbi:hypothetical protein ACO1O0_003945 [Amphichorda felina]